MDLSDNEAIEEYFGCDYLDDLFHAAFHNQIYIEGLRQTDLTPAQRFLGALSVDLGGGTVEINYSGKEELDW